MNRFNLTFSGEIIEGHDPELAQAGMAHVLAIDDPDLIQRCFSGNTVVLRRNLERREAAELYARLRRFGVHAELVKIGERGDLHGGEKVSSPAHREPDSGRASTGTGPIEPASPPPAEARVTGPVAAVKDTLEDRMAPATDTTGQEARQAAESRRADRAARKHLQAEEAALLDDKEKALKKALKARQRDAARRARATERARQKTLAREARHKAKLEAAKLKAAQEQAKAEAVARQAAEKAERERKLAQEALKRAQEQARARAEREEQLAQQRALEEQAMARAADKLAQKNLSKPVEARVRTRLETPSRRRGPAGETRRKRQPGAPNLYSLTPFRNTPAIRDRPAQSQRIMRKAFAGAAIAFALALLLAARLLSLPAWPSLTGASGIAVSPQQRPVLLAGDHLLLHDRAGAS
ncbi:MAG: hypothetical protein V2I26_18160, partial [Halieaceae bacterium]|nr:hypothetical protein [Halieaceae bacterium]